MTSIVEASSLSFAGAIRFCALLRDLHGDLHDHELLVAPAAPAALLPLPSDLGLDAVTPHDALRLDALGALGFDDLVASHDLQRKLPGLLRLLRAVPNKQWRLSKIARGLNLELGNHLCTWPFGVRCEIMRSKHSMCWTLEI